MDLLRKKMILDIEVLENSLELKNEVRNSGVPIPIVLMVNCMLNA